MFVGYGGFIGERYVNRLSFQVSMECNFPVGRRRSAMAMWEIGVDIRSPIQTGRWSNPMIPRRGGICRLPRYCVWRPYKGSGQCLRCLCMPACRCGVICGIRRGFRNSGSLS